MNALNSPDELYKTGKVIRYHANPRMARLQQTDADHSWGVVAIIVKLFPDASKNLIVKAIFHDCGELKACDLSYPFKRANPEIAALHQEAEFAEAVKMGIPQVDVTKEEAVILGFADRLESMLLAHLYMPHILEMDGWQEQTRSVMELAEKLGVLDKVLALIEGTRT